MSVSVPSGPSEMSGVRCSPGMTSGLSFFSPRSDALPRGRALLLCRLRNRSGVLGRGLLGLGLRGVGPPRAASSGCSGCGSSGCLGRAPRPRAAPQPAAPRPAAPPGRRAARVPRSSLYLQGLRLLGRVGMVGPGVDLQLAQLLPGEAVAREHALDRQPDDLLGLPLEHVPERAHAQAARIARVAVVALLLALVARNRDLLRVHDDHEVADVAVRRVLRLALAAQGVCQLRGQPSERLAGGVDDEPVALALSGCCDVGLHGQENRAAHAAARGRPMVA